MKRELPCLLAAAMLTTPAVVWAEDVTVTAVCEPGGSYISGTVAIADAQYARMVTLTVYDEQGKLNYMDVFMTDADGNATFRYDNTGASGEYICNISVEDMGVTEQIVLDDFKGKDFWTAFVQQVNDAISIGDSTALRTQFEQCAQYLASDMSVYENLADKEAVFELMLTEGGTYDSAQSVINHFFRAVYVTDLAEHPTADRVWQLYIDDGKLGYFGFSDVLPAGSQTNGTVLDDLKENLVDQVFADIAAQTYHTTEAFTKQMLEQGLLGVIRHAFAYTDVKTVVEAYAAKGLLNIDSSNGTTAIYRNMMKQDYPDFQAVAAAFADSGTAGGGGNPGGSGSGGAPNRRPSSSSSGSGMGTGMFSTGNQSTAAPEPEVETATGQSGYTPFSDMEDCKWALPAVQALYDAKIITGDGDGRFSPHRTISRAEMAKLLVAMTDTPLTEEDIPFVDVVQDSWYFPYVGTAYHAGMFQGISETAFAPADGITREAAATALYRVLHLQEDAEEQLFTDDADISGWAREAVYTLRAQGIVSGTSNGVFAPKAFLTRAEAAQMLYNAWKK